MNNNQGLWVQFHGGYIPMQPYMQHVLFFLSILAKGLHLFV